MKKLAKTVSAVVLALTVVGATQAAAKPKLHEAQFFGSPDNAPTVRVGAENGRWVLMKSPGITYRFSYYVKANRPLQMVMVGAGDFPAELMAPFVRGKISTGSNLQRTAWGQGSFTLPNNQIGSDRAKVLAACNALLDQGKSTAAQHETHASLQLVARVTVRSAPVHTGTTGFSRLHGTTMVKVICEPEGTDIQAPPEPYSIDLNLTSLEDKCPQKTEVRAFIRYKVPATARFRFVHNGKKSVWHEIKARKIDGKPKPEVSPGASQYLVERVKYYHLDPGEHRFRIEMASGKKSGIETIKIKCPPFKVTSDWLKYDVEDTPVCDKWVEEEAIFKSTRPGSAPFRIKTQGGLEVHSGTAKFERDGLEYVARIKRKLKMGAFDQDMLAEITNDPAANSGWTRLRVECLELTGDFSFIDKGGPRCKRVGQALINFSMNMAVDVHYSLDCTNGHFSGVAQAVPDNKGGYVAPALAKFDIEKTAQVTCALKSVSPGKTKVHTLKGHLFQCITPAGHSGTNDLTSDRRTTHNTPTTADKVAIDPPRVPPRTRPGKIVEPVRIVCRNGAVRNQSCFCPRKHRKVKTGPNAWRCDRIVVVVPPKKGGSSLTSGGGKRKNALKLRRSGKKRRLVGKRRKNRAMRLR